jgi:hypothetical protein
MIEWLNLNSGFMLSVLTLVYAVTTLIMAWFMRKSNKLSHDAILQGYALEKKRSKPYIIFDFEVKKSCLLASLSNIGLNPAYNIKVTIEPKIIVERNQCQQESVLTKEVIKFMAPNRKLEDFICAPSEFSRILNNTIYTGNISYSDDNGVQYNDPFTIDLTYRKQLLFLKEVDANEELEKISNSLNEISKKISI